MLDAWALRVLVAVADTGSFSAAAESLSMTQPAVSRQVQNLEHRLGTTLFRRESRGVRPTPVGEAAIEHARGVLARLDAMEASLRAHAGLEAGRLRISAHASANTAFVPEAIRRFASAHPAIELALHAPDPAGPIAAVRDARVDVALVTAWQLYADPDAARAEPTGAPLTAADLPGLDLVELLAEDLDVALPAGHPLAAREVVPLRALRGEVWIDGAFPDCLGPLDTLHRALGGPPHIGFFCDDWNGKLALVAAGVGATLVPRLARPAARPGVELRPTSPRLPTRAIFAVVAERPYRSAPTDAMLAVLADLAATV